MSGRLTHRYRPFVLSVAAILLAPTLAFAQSPWERAANNLALTFTGPLARSLALVAIVIGGLLSCSVRQPLSDRSRASSSAADLRCSRRNFSSGCSDTRVALSKARACQIARRTVPCTRHSIAP